MHGFVLQVRKSWRLYTVIPLFSFQNWALLHQFLNMFTKSVKHVSIGLKRLNAMLSTPILRVLTPFCGPFQSFRCPETSTSDWLFGKRLSTLLCFPALQSLPEASEPWRWGSQRICCEFHRQSNQGHARGVVLYGSALRKRWSLHQHDKHRKRWHCSLNPASAKMLLCSTCDTRIQTKSNLPSNVSQQLLATTGIDIDLALASLALHDFSWHFSMVFSQSLILQSSLKYLTSTNCCGSGSPWAMKQMV